MFSSQQRLFGVVWLLVVGGVFSPAVIAAQDPVLANDTISEMRGVPGSEARRTRSREAAVTATEVLNSSTELEDIQIDGVLDEPDWETARVFSGFTQREPVEGGPAEHDTEVRVLFGDDAIWIAARMWDADPTAIDRRLARRDAHSTSDQFSVHLDPNLDGLTG